MLNQDKKALSEIVGYVILILIAITLSLLVYGFMKNLLPKFSQECPSEISLAVDDYACDVVEKKIALDIKNTGTYNVEGFIIKAKNKTEGLAINPLEQIGSLGEQGSVFTEPILKPGEIQAYEFSYARHRRIEQIEIEPFKIIPKQAAPALCKEAVITQSIEGCE